VIGILVVDPYVLVRKGICALLQSQPDLKVLAEVGSYAEAIAALRGSRFDVVIADISMAGLEPARDSINLIAQVRALQAHARLIVLTMHTENPYATRALRAGADGYVTKDTTPDLLIAAIHRVMSGAPYLSPNIAESLALSAARQQQDFPAHQLLSKRERTVFKLLAQGNDVRDIAGQLALSVKTVSTHKFNVLRKMNLRSVAELVRYAIEHDVIYPW
jgi:DNA-binding NarL/FixJ family response regulator